MPYVVESTNKLSPLRELAGFLLGHYSGFGTAYTALRIGAPVVRSALGAVAAPRTVYAYRPPLTPWPGVNAGLTKPVVAPTMPVIKYTPPPPPKVASVDPGNNVAPTSTAPTFQLVAPTGSRTDPYNTGLPFQYGQAAGSGPSPIPGVPEVEVGTLSAPGKLSLAGLTSSPLILGGLALAAFMFLGDSKPKRRRR